MYKDTADVQTFKKVKDKKTMGFKSTGNTISIFWDMELKVF